MKHDLRTREGQRQTILDQIKASGGFSLWFATHSKLRSKVLTDMEKIGEITVTPIRYPRYMAYINKRRRK